ncbi:MAG: MFS transporter [Acidimicrobiales bacterium]
MSPRPRRRSFGDPAAPGGAGPPAGRAHLAWTVSPLLLAVTALGRSSQNAGQTTYPLLGHSALHMSNSTIGDLGAAAGVTAILCAGLVGRARREHALAMLAAGQVCGLAAFVLLALPSGRLGVGAAAVALGAYGGLAFPSIMTAIGGGPRHERARALAIFATALSASLLLGPLLEAAVLEALGGSLRATFAVLLPIPAASTVLAVLAATRERKATLASRRDEAGRPSSAQRTGAPAGGADGIEPAAAVRAQPAFRVAVTMMVTYQVPFAALVAFGALLARHTDGTSASGAEAAFGVFFGVSLLVRTGLAVATPRRATALLLAASVAATAGGLALVAEARGFPVLLCGMVLLGLPHGATLPLASGLLAEWTPEHQLTRANGLLMATTNTVTVVVPPFCGWLADAIGYPRTFLVLEVPVVVLGALLVAQLRSPRFPVTWREAEIAELPADA